MASGLDLAWLDLVHHFTSAVDATNVINLLMIEAVKILHPLLIDSDDINNDNSADGINDYDIAHDNDGDNGDNDDGDDDGGDDDDYGRDAVGVSHAAPPRLRPPDNGSLGGATYTPLYPPVYCTVHMYIHVYMQRTSCLGGAGVEISDTLMIASFCQTQLSSSSSFHQKLSSSLC